MWFDWSFKNPEKVSPNHSAIYFFAIEHCNRLGWKEKFGFPTQMAMEAIGIKKCSTYIRYFNDLVEWGFFILIQKSHNQYSSNIISLASSLKTAMPKNGEALGKAIGKHAAKQMESIGQSTGKSNSTINKQVTNELSTNEGGGTLKDPPPTSNNNLMLSYAETLQEFKTAQNWKELLCINYKLDLSFVESDMEKFLFELNEKDQFPKQLRQTKEYYTSRLKKYLEKKKTEKQQYKPLEGAIV